MKHCLLFSILFNIICSLSFGAVIPTEITCRQMDGDTWAEVAILLRHNEPYLLVISHETASGKNTRLRYAQAHKTENNPQTHYTQTHYKGYFQEQTFSFDIIEGPRSTLGNYFEKSVENEIQNPVFNMQCQKKSKITFDTKIETKFGTLLLDPNNGDVAKFNQYDALRACPIDTHLPTVREWAAIATAFGAEGILKQSNDHRQIVAKNLLDNTVDVIAFSEDGYKENKTGLFQHEFWTSSIYSYNSSAGLVFIGRKGFFYPKYYSLEAAVLCIPNQDPS